MADFIPVSATKSAIRLRMRIFKKNKDCYYPPGLRAFELSARAVQFFKTCTGKILRIWGISSKKILKIWGNFRQKDFEGKNILCIFATNCNINK